MDAEMKLTGDTSRPSPLRLYADARIAPVDIRMAFPAMTSMIASLPAGSDMSLKADIDGTTQSLDIHTIEASVPRILAIEAGGRINHPLDTERTSGRIDIKGRLTGLNTIKPSLLDARLAHHQPAAHSTKRTCRFQSATDIRTNQRHIRRRAYRGRRIMAADH